MLMRDIQIFIYRKVKYKRKYNLPTVVINLTHFEAERGRVENQTKELALVVAGDEVRLGTRKGVPTWATSWRKHSMTNSDRLNTATVLGEEASSLVLKHTAVEAVVAMDKKAVVVQVR